MLLSSTIMALLEMLGDGKWHAIKELFQQSGIADYKVHGIVEFLSRFDFAVVDESNEKVKISRDFQEFLRLT